MDVFTKSKSLLNPLDRVSEILFGLIMTLTFTCSIGIATRGPAQIRELMIGAVGCNVAWGIVDATMYLIGVLAQKSRSKTILASIRNSSETDTASQYISDALPAAIVKAIGVEGLEQIRNKLIALPNASTTVRLTVQDVKRAMVIFFLVFISTFPVVIPFIFIQDAKLALRVSNLIAIVMMFLCGWAVAKYVGCSKWIMSVVIVFIGVFLVAITIVFGG